MKNAAPGVAPEHGSFFFLLFVSKLLLQSSYENILRYISSHTENISTLQSFPTASVCSL